jgi:hypothetical protein
MELWPRARLVCVCRGALASPTGGCYAANHFFDCLLRCAFAFSVGASAAKLTEQQVKDTREKSFNQPHTAQGPSRGSARSQ